MAALASPSPSLPSGVATGWRLSSRNVERLSRGVIGIAVFSGAFVIEEPAPYELLLVALMAVWLICGLRLDRFAIALTGLFVLFNIGGMLSMFTMDAYGGIPLYLAVSLFLGFTSVFWCAAITADMGRLRTVMRAYALGAAATAALGIAGYFDAFPGAEVFTRYERAKGAFQDPNVFGPFLVLPAVYLLHGLVHRWDGATLVRAGLLTVILAGLFLSFSRAAWGMLLLCAVIYYALALATTRSDTMRLRMIVLAVVGLGAVLLLLTVLLQFEAVSQMFSQRAALAQDYDSGEHGRFARHLVGLMWALENPLGIGPLEFGQILGEDTHNIWIKALMAYGWIGFLAWGAMTVITLVGGWRLLGRPRPWQPYLHCLYAVFIGQLVIAWVIDIDHWRHFYLIVGLIWGCMALEARRGDEHAPHTAEKWSE